MASGPAWSQCHAAPGPQLPPAPDAAEITGCSDVIRLLSWLRLSAAACVPRYLKPGGSGVVTITAAILPHAHYASRRPLLHVALGSPQPANPPAQHQVGVSQLRRAASRSGPTITA